MTSEELRAWRKAQDLTLRELAGLLGVALNTVARWELGTRKIPPFLHLALEALENRRRHRKKEKGDGLR